MLQLHCSKARDQPRFSKCSYEVVYLSLEINSSRTCQIAFIIRLLHRRGRLVAHHGPRSAPEVCPYGIYTIDILLVLQHFLERSGVGDVYHFVRQTVGDVGQDPGEEQGQQTLLRSAY